MRATGATSTAVGYGPGDHVCWVFSGIEAWRAAAVSYLDEGRAVHDRLLYVCDRPEPSLLADLGALPDRDAMLASGQLQVIPMADAYPAERGAGAAAARVAAFKALMTQALADGYRALRVAADVSALAIDADDVPSCAAHELLVDTVMASDPMISMCGYDRDRVEADVIRAMALVHPLTADDRQPEARCGLHAAAPRRWKLTGEVDRGTRASLEVAFEAFPTDADVELDLSELRFIDVAGVRALIALADRLDDGRRLVLRDPPSTVDLILRVGWGPLTTIDVRRT